MNDFYSNPLVFLHSYKFHIVGVLLLLTILGLFAQWKKRDPKETLSNVFLFMGNNMVNLFLGQALQLSTFLWLEHYSLQLLPINFSTTILCILAVDFCYYWRHRWEHKIQIIWAEHSVHHSSKEYNFSTSLRLPWITPLFGWIFFAPAVLVGFPSQLVMASYVINLLYQYWVHNEVIGKLKFLDSFLVTPSNHRVHHARNKIYLDKNFGGIFVVWDWLFGSYEPETEKPEYGIVHPIESQNPLIVNWEPFRRIFAKFSEAKTGKEKLSVFFGPPTV